MTPDTLTGRELDCAVAEAMGWTRVGPNAYYGMDRPEGVPPQGGPVDWIPTFSWADCSGLAPVLAWLGEYGPSLDDAELDSDWLPPEFQCGKIAVESWWWAGYVAEPRSPHVGAEVCEYARGITLPIAACRLLVAWAEQKVVRA